MRKNIISLFLILTLIVCVISGCGQKKITSLDDIDKMSSDEFSDYVQNQINEIEKDYEQDEREKQEEQEEVMSGYPTFERLPAWDTIKNKDMAFQIFDVLVYPGMSVTNLIKQVEASEMDWEYVYDPVLKVGGNTSETGELSFKLNGETVFFGNGYNPMREESLELQKCTINIMCIQDDFTAYARGFNGEISLDFYKEMSKEELDNLSNTIYKDFYLVKNEHKFGEKSNNYKYEVYFEYEMELDPSLIDMNYETHVVAHNNFFYQYSHTTNDVTYASLGFTCLDTEIEEYEKAKVEAEATK